MVTLTRLDCAVAIDRPDARRASRRRCITSAIAPPSASSSIDQPLMLRVLADMALDLAGAAGALAAARGSLRHGRGAAGGGRLCAADDAGGEILGVQDRAGLPLRGDGVPRRQRLRRGERAAAALSRGAGQRDLGGLRQRHGARRGAGAEGRGRARAGARRRSAASSARARRPRSTCSPRQRAWRARTRARRAS